MDDEKMTATATIEAPPDAVFAVLVDRSAHAAIDGTGWAVRYGSSLMHSKLRPPVGVRWRLTVGASSTPAPLVAAGPRQTTVTLTYDWSAVPPPVREDIQFPSFGSDLLESSLQHVARLAE